MGKHNIEKFSLSYKILFYWGKALHNCLYSKVHIFNKPKKIKKAHIFASNHQNALMDAMAMLFGASRTQVFLARSDIFKNPIVASMLYFIKILPVFRIRDGYENLKNNDEVFENSVRVLNHHRTLSLLPEGNHAGFKRLRTLQKGFARIAFQAMESKNNDDVFFIVPIGIEYEHYEKFGTALYVNFGNPIEISQYYQTYQNNQAQGLSELRDRLGKEIKKLIINIESERWYYLILRLTDWNRVLLKNKGEKAKIIFDKNQNLASKLSYLNDNDKTAADLEEKCQKLDMLLAEDKLIFSEIGTKNDILINLLLLLINIPLLIISLPAFIFLGWFFFLVKTIVNKKIKDPQFRTSVRFGIYVTATIPLILVISLLSLIIFPWYAFFISIAVTVIATLVGLKIAPICTKLYLRFKTGVLDLIGHKKTKEIINLRDEIFEQIIHINR